MSVPTRMRTGAVASRGILTTTGPKKMDRAKRRETVRLVRPVLPPTLIPAADSQATIRGLVPRKAPSALPAAAPR